MIHPGFDVEDYLSAPTPKRSGRKRLQRAYKAPIALMGQDAGREGELAVTNLLRRYGFRTEHMPYNSPYDVLLDGSVRLEIKTAQAYVDERGAPAWRVNIHRHGVVNEDHVDIYILRLEEVPFFSDAIHLLLKAPLGIPTIKVSLRSLLDVYAGRAADFHAFCKARKLAANTGLSVEG